MNDILKQRLVGALILLALGVVFWPIIFVQPEQRQVADLSPLPPPPAVVAEPIPTPDASGLRSSPPSEAVAPASEVIAPATQAPAATVSGEVAPAISPGETDKPAALSAASPESSAREEPPQNLKMDSDGVPIAWTLQVATVSAPEKAAELRGKLLQMNQKAYVVTVTSGGKTLYRVCIGPKFERGELEKIQAGVNAQFGVNSMVVRYVP